MDTLKTIMNYNLGSLSLAKILGTAITLVLCILAIKAVLNIAGKALGKTKADKALTTFVMAAAKVLLIALAGMIVAEKLGIPVNSVVAIFSVATLSLSLAAQGVLSNVFGGIILLITHPFKAGEYTEGDYIEAAGVEGFVQKMGLSYTTIMTWTKEIIVVPNSALSTSVIKNYAAEDTRRVDIAFGTSYTAPTEAVKAAAMQAAANIPEAFTDPAPAVILTDFADGGIHYAVRVYCKNADYWTVRGALTEQVRAELAKAGCEMSYSHVNVHVLDK